jgi:hypothetical protein
VKSYPVTVYYQTSQEMTVCARSREEAIDKATKRCERLGIEAITMKLPYLEGDKE